MLNKWIGVLALCLVACAAEVSDNEVVEVEGKAEPIIYSKINSGGGAALNGPDLGWQGDLLRATRAMAMGHGCSNNKNYWTCSGHSTNNNVAGMYGLCVRGSSEISIEECQVLNGNQNTIKCMVFSNNVYIPNRGGSGSYLLFEAITLTRKNTYGVNFFFDSNTANWAGFLDYQGNKANIPDGWSYSVPSGPFCP